MTVITPRSAPHALEAEEAVLGCILINPETYYEVAPLLAPDDFFLHKHRWIWDAFASLSAQHLDIDIVTVAHELVARKQLGEVGGSAYLTRLINAVPTSVNAPSYATLVEQEATKRRLLEAASQVARLAYEPDSDTDKLVSDASAVVMASKRDRQRKLMPMRDAIALYYDRLKRLIDDPSQRLGLPTELVDLDKLLGGLYKGDLVIIAGRPGSGKTAYMLSIAKSIAASTDLNGQPKEPKHVAMFSMEMPVHQLVTRLLANQAQFEISDLRMGNIRPEEDWEGLETGMQVLSEHTLYLDDTAALTPNQLRAKCIQVQNEFGLDLVVVDYLQLMGIDGRRENRTQEVSYISRSLKRLAMELEVPVLAGAQLNRAIEHRQDKKPVLADLRDSGTIEQDADIVKFIIPEGTGNISVIDVAKHRNGPTGAVHLIFRKEFGRFENAEVRHVDLSQVV